MLGVLEVLDTGQQHAGVGDDGPARLEHQGQVAAVQALADGADVVAGQRRLFVAVAHPEATTEVQVANADAFAGQAVDQPEQALEGVEEGLQLGQLRADVAVDADHLQVVKLGGAGVDRLGLVDGDAELVLFQAGGDIGWSGRPRPG